jgi:hypothetical protein
LSEEFKDICGDICGGESERRPFLRECGVYMWLYGIVCVAVGEKERESDEIIAGHARINH